MAEVIKFPIKPSTKQEGIDFWYLKEVNTGMLTPISACRDCACAIFYSIADSNDRICYYCGTINLGEI